MLLCFVISHLSYLLPQGTLCGFGMQLKAFEWRIWENEEINDQKWGGKADEVQWIPGIFEEEPDFQCW